MRTEVTCAVCEAHRPAKAEDAFGSIPIGDRRVEIGELDNLFVKRHVNGTDCIEERQPGGQIANRSKCGRGWKTLALDDLIGRQGGSPNDDS